MSSDNKTSTTAKEKSFPRRDFEYTTQMNRWFLTPIGVWPLPPNAGIVMKLKTGTAVCCCYFLICFVLIPTGIHTFTIERNPARRLKRYGPMSFCVMAIVKLSLLLFHRKDLYNCLEHIAADWGSVRSSEERATMLRDAKFGRFVAGLSAAFMYGGGFFYRTIMPLSLGMIVTPDNRSVRPLTYPIYDSFFNAQRSPIYEIVFATQWFSGFVIYTITIGVCSIAAVFAMHACGQFKILVGRLNKLVHGDVERCDSVNERLADIVELHLRALRFVRQLEDVLTEICFVELIGCTMNICLLGYYFMTEWEQSKAINTITYCVLLLSFICNILIFCYIGDKLGEESAGIGTMTYMIDWYRLQDTKASQLILILIVSKFSVRLTAGKMAELSMTCFSNVMRTALTYLNLLRAMMR